MSNDKIHCDCSECQKTTEHKYTSKPDPNHTPSNSYLSSSRGVKPEYRTLECVKCGTVSTWDFARD